MAQKAARQRHQSLTLLVLLLPVSGAAWWGMKQAPPPAAQGNCGPFSLHVLCQRLGVDVSRQEVKSRFVGSAETCSFAELQSAAQSLGLTAQGRQMTIEALQREKPKGILHVDQKHFVAIVGYEKNGARIADSSADSTKQPQVYQSIWPYSMLAGRWNGRILVVTRNQIKHQTP